MIVALWCLRYRRRRTRRPWDVGVGLALLANVLVAHVAAGADPGSMATPLQNPAYSDVVRAALTDRVAPFAFAPPAEPPVEKPGIPLAQFRLVPYGALWGDVVYATERTNTGPFTLFVFSAEQQGEEMFQLDVRRTRLGFDLVGDEVDVAGGAQSGGRVEIDFHGDFITENRASVLLRHAYWEFKNDEFKLLFGQSWDVISPLMPGMLNYAVGWNAGNIGFRRAQLQFDRYWQLENNAVIKVETAMNQDVVNEFPTEPGVRREAAGWPVLEARTALAWGDPQATYGRPEIGFSGHIGETGFDFLLNGPPPLDLPPQDDARFRTWSMNFDARLPLTDDIGVALEAFHGENLSTFLGGIGQGVCPCNRSTIRSTGGWLDVWFELTDKWHARCGFGIDDPRDDDFLVGRYYNQYIYANVLADVTPFLQTGVEVSVWKTLYKDDRAGQIDPALLGPTAPGEAVVIQWMARYGF